ncbi:CopG family transcriptional regulator [Streptacidiphilus anmyonensis]|uniref:ribbon-helix-helix domain-containing protein n=1 Tax=Streptacidiphilus anmyonensis TaxID=405782 RepID=UPI0005A81C45|nr:CopG family transcriptional regulator [Streptacidiphilus anmyonensis]
MVLKRTTVYAEAEDLAVIKEAAAREGVPEAEIIREAIHLAALSKRVWAEPLDWPMISGEAPAATASDVWGEKAAAYERSKRSPS